MYIRFLAYHYVSNRFRSFMLDNELERMEAGWLLYDGKARIKVCGYAFILKIHSAAYLSYVYVYRAMVDLIDSYFSIVG